MGRTHRCGAGGEYKKLFPLSPTFDGYEIDASDPSRSPGKHHGGAQTGLKPVRALFLGGRARGTADGLGEVATGIGGTVAGAGNERRRRPEASDGRAESTDIREKSLPFLHRRPGPHHAELNKDRQTWRKGRRQREKGRRWREQQCRRHTRGVLQGEREQTMPVSDRMHRRFDWTPELFAGGLRD